MTFVVLTLSIAIAVLGAVGIVIPTAPPSAVDRTMAATYRAPCGARA